MQTETITTVDITPSWASILPVLLAVYGNAVTADSRNFALDELRKMAKLADAYASTQR